MKPSYRHFARNMANNFLPHDKDQYTYIMNMQQEKNEALFKWKLNNFPTKFQDNWFLHHYGEDGKIASPSNWARCYNLYHPMTSMAAEGNISHIHPWLNH